MIRELYVSIGFQVDQPKSTTQMASIRPELPYQILKELYFFGDL